MAVTVLFRGRGKELHGITKQGFVATLHMRGVPLCCSPDREVDEGGEDRL